MEITGKDVDELGKGLKQIRNIIFCDNSIGLQQGSLERLVALLLCCGFLESTSFIRNCLNDDHVPKILSLLQGHQSLTRISLSWYVQRQSCAVSGTVFDLRRSYARGLLLGTASAIVELLKLPALCMRCTM